MVDWQRQREQLLGDMDDGLPPDIRLPMLSKAVNDFTERSNDPEATNEELAAIVETDAALTCELLRYVNSSAVGLRREVNSAAHAIGLLGIAKVRLMVLTTAAKNAAAARPSKLVNPQTFWNTNLERALFTRRIASLMRVDEDVSYAAGMLQDFLLPTLSSERLDQYVAFGEQQDREPGDLVVFEKQVFGWDHALAAARMAHDWGLPAQLVCCIGMHHQGLEMLRHPELARTPVAAVAIGALMPEPFRQHPGGFELLDRLDAAWPKFDLVEFGERVAEDFAEFSNGAEGTSAFARRCARLAAERECAPCP